jgi:hypothetical protein
MSYNKSLVLTANSRRTVQSFGGGTGIEKYEKTAMQWLKEQTQNN